MKWKKFINEILLDSNLKKERYKDDSNTTTQMFRHYDRGKQDHKKYSFK